LLLGGLWEKYAHRAHEIDYVLKSSSIDERFPQAFPLHLEFVRVAVVVLKIARGVRHLTLLPRCPTTAKSTLGSNSPRFCWASIEIVLSDQRSVACREDIAWLGVGKKFAVLFLPRVFRGHLFEHRASLCSLVGIFGEFLKMDAVLLNLNFEAVQSALGIE
jgi:hypothetical protein